MYDEYDRLFKDDLKSDISATFINLEEFSQLKWIDGVLIPCQVAHYTGESSSRQNETYAGLHGDYTTVSFEADNYTRKRERLPRNGEQIYLDGKRYDVVTVQNVMGVAKIVCTAYRQNTLRQKPFDGSSNPYGTI